MKNIILVTGTPGTGKSDIAKKIAKHYGYEYIHIGDHKDYVVSEGEVKIIDVDKMIKWLQRQQESGDGGLVVDSHLSHYYPAKDTKICIVLRCDPAELKNRLKLRGYNENKILINLEAEAMDLILQEALIEKHRVYEIDTTHRTSNSSSQEAINAIINNEINYGKTNYNHYLTKLKKPKKA
ncbi:MAG: adenylate kinase family protein [Candidatus Nanoarchaeia archaeon]|jgi:adenylate kinase